MRIVPLAVLSLFLAGCSSLPPWSPVPTGQTSLYGKITTPVATISFIAFSDNPDIAAVSIEYGFGRYAPRYALVADGQGEHWVRGFKVKAVDTTAAGDVFCGALAVRLAEGSPLLEAVRFAHAAAAISVTRAGAQPSIPSRREILSKLRP